MERLGQEQQLALSGNPGRVCRWMTVLGGAVKFSRSNRNNSAGLRRLACCACSTQSHSSVFARFGMRLDGFKARYGTKCICNLCACCLRLLEAGCDDGKSELLLCKVFTLIAGELFRSHGGQLFEYSNGAWAPASRGLTSVALEFILKALRRAQAYFGVMANDEDCKKQRCFDFVGFVVKVIQHVGGDEVLLQWQLQDVLPKKTELKAKHWAHGLSELCKVLRHQFDEHHRHSGSSLWGEELRECTAKARPLAICVSYSSCRRCHVTLDAAVMQESWDVAGTSVVLCRPACRLVQECAESFSSVVR